jgi:Domain of Unknown Function (DUF1080)
MYRLAVTFSLLAGSAFAAASDFNGRWDITVQEENRKRAWWLEVTGAETGQPAGSFIGAPGGGLDKLAGARIEKGELTFSFDRKSREGKEWKGVYRAKLVSGKLDGTFEATGITGPVRWTGVRAPKPQTADLTKLKTGKAVELFNGKDLAGWRPLHADRRMEWDVKDGITGNQPGAVDLVTEQKFWNFKLHAEYRVGPKSNSGIGLRGRYEVQILEDHGRPVSLHGNGALYSRILPSQNASKPPNEWQTFDITLVGNRVTVELNGARIIDDKEIEGLTAIAIDPSEGEPGPIIIQGDHGAVQFRKLTLTPLLGK